MTAQASRNHRTRTVPASSPSGLAPVSRFLGPEGGAPDSSQAEQYFTSARTVLAAQRAQIAAASSAAPRRRIPRVSPARLHMSSAAVAGLLTVVVAVVTLTP
jgi:hypothetical protein